MSNVRKMQVVLLVLLHEDEAMLSVVEGIAAVVEVRRLVVVPQL